MRIGTTRGVLPLMLIFAVACGDDDPMNPGPGPATIPQVAGMYAISSTNADPTCDVAVPHPEVLDGPASSTGQMEVKQTGGAVDMEITELDGFMFSAAQADSSSLVGTIDTTGTGPITRMLDFQAEANDSTLYFISQSIAGTVGFTTGTPINLTSSITFTTEYRPDSATAALLATCTTTGTITGNSL